MAEKVDAYKSKAYSSMLITELKADKVVVRGPNVDGGYAITFYVGEYMQSQASEIMKIPQQTEITLVVHAENTIHVEVKDD